MFRFFRQLRKKLIGNGQVRRYLLYAVGEIALVVIGILIALQIDTWNEERIGRKKETGYLKEIKANLEEDIKTVRSALNFNHGKDSVITAVLNQMMQSKSNRTTVIYIGGHMPVLAEYRVFTQNRVAFDNMLSAESIDLISDDELRYLLSDYYSQENLLDGTQERVKELTRNFVDHISPLLMNREVLRMVTGTDYPEMASADNLEIRTNRTIIGDLFSMQKNLESHDVYLENYATEIDSLSSRISAFLKGRE